MNPNTELLLAKVEQSSRWEDEEKATYGVEQLREEFRHRLYGSAPAAAEEDKPAGVDAK
jgi:hypothetical protein